LYHYQIIDKTLSTETSHCLLTYHTAGSRMEVELSDNRS